MNTPSTVREGTRRFAKQVRSPADLRKLSDFEQRIYVPLVLSAILPILTAASRSGTDSWVSIVVNVAAWLVFVLDLVVHVRLVRHYIRSKAGVFDLVVVILTAPWFLIPAFGGSQILMLARLARLVRLLFVSKAARRAGRQLGRVGIFSFGMLLFCAWMAYVAEHPTNDEFATFGDALWWAVVTLTTVGYGDIVPVTEKGRIAGTFLMLTGVATLGLISGTLASAFHIAPGEEGAPVPAPAVPGGAPAAAAGGPADVVVDELVAVRNDLAVLDQRLAALVASSAPAVTADPADPST
jgi:voltage-gated potassium channel